MKEDPDHIPGDLTRQGPTWAMKPASEDAALARILGLSAYSLRTPIALATTADRNDPIHFTPSGRIHARHDDWDTANTRAICDYVMASGEPVLLGDLGEKGAEDAPFINGLAGEVSNAVAYAAVPLRSPSGQPLGVLCVVDNRPRAWNEVDLHTLRELAVAIEGFPQFSLDKKTEVRHRLSLKLDAVGRLAGGIAHDFNNILTTIRGHADLLIEDLSSGDPRRPDLEEIRRSATRAAQLTSRLLAFSRKQVLRPGVLDLARLLPLWAARMRRELGDSVRIDLEIGPAVRSVRADQERIESAISDLVTNAADSMPEGGAVMITASNAILDAHFASGFPYRVEAGSYTRIAITDQGHGMDEETLEKIFEPFFTTRRPAQGAGLGLSTVYGIIKQSGGYIWADSKPGQGTTIELYLPHLHGTDTVPN
jgi:signal transduction histidine kinase